MPGTLERLFKAFADETRLRILHLLARERELCVCDLTAVLRAPQPKVSRHLAYLRAAGLVADRKEGRWIHYSLSKPTGAIHKCLVACLGGCFREDAARLRRLGGRKGAACG